jgi:hypothetical protein
MMQLRAHRGAASLSLERKECLSPRACCVREVEHLLFKLRAIRSCVEMKPAKLEARGQARIHLTVATNSHQRSGLFRQDTVSRMDSCR